MIVQIHAAKPVVLYCPACLVSRINVFTSRIPLDRETSQDDFFYDNSTTKRKCHPKLEGLRLDVSARLVRGCDGDFEFVDSGSCECSRLQGVVGDEWNGAPFDRIRRCPHPFMTDKVQRFATRCTMCHLGSLKIPIAICGISGGNIFPMVCRINFQRRSHLLHTGTYRDPR